MYDIAQRPSSARHLLHLASVSSFVEVLSPVIPRSLLLASVPHDAFHAPLSLAITARANVNAAVIAHEDPLFDTSAYY